MQDKILHYQDNFFVFRRSLSDWEPSIRIQFLTSGLVYSKDNSSLLLSFNRSHFICVIYFDYIIFIASLLMLVGIQDSNIYVLIYLWGTGGMD